MTAEVIALIEGSQYVATSIVARVEATAAFAKGLRMGWIDEPTARAALAALDTDWTSLIRISLSEAMLGAAANLAWDHGLRGYDAVHLAAALSLKERLEEDVLFASFDRQLNSVANRVKMQTWPALSDMEA